MWGYDFLHRVIFLVLLLLLALLGLLRYHLGVPTHLVDLAVHLSQHDQLSHAVHQHHSLLTEDRQHVRTTPKAAAAAAQEDVGSLLASLPSEAPSVTRRLQFPAPQTKYKIHSTKRDRDLSARCESSDICDFASDCGGDQLGCVRGSGQRQHLIKMAARESWDAYKCVAG